jgi:hypothetical protein
MELHLSSAEIPEDSEMRLTPHHPLQFLGHLDAAPHDDHVDIVGRTFKEDVPDISPDDITLESETVGRLADLVEYFLVENVC